MSGSEDRPSGDLERWRQTAIDKVLALRQENAPRISDPKFVSHTGYNHGYWADRGFRIALEILGGSAPEAGEIGPDFLERAKEQIRTRRDEYRADEVDEEAACSGALDAAMSAISGLLPKEAPSPKHPQSPLNASAMEGEWEVWYTDTFDRECPPKVEVRGRGLEDGLLELWARFLFETVRHGGGKGFSRFHVMWNRRAVAIDGDWSGATRLRKWAFGSKEHCQGGYAEAGDVGLLKTIAHAHAALLLAARSGEEVLAAAAVSEDRSDFEARLSGLIER